MNSLSAHDVACCLGPTEVLKEISLQLRAQRIVALVGPNGAGKTTLLRCLSGLQTCSGTILYADTPLSQLSRRQQAQRRTYVAQSIHRQLPYTVLEILAMGQAHRSRWYTSHATQLTAVMTDSMALLGLEPSLAEKRFDALSGGEQQQVLVCRALMADCPIVLLDEPTSALDLRHRVTLMRALRAAADKGAAVLISLHDLNLAAQCCDEIVLLDQGKIAARGTAQDVFQSELLSRVYQTPVAIGKLQNAQVPTVELVL